MIGSNQRPAILGGPQAVTLDGTQANRWPLVTERDKAAVLAVMDDGDLSCHPVTRQLETDFRNYFGVRHALAHSNGTAAMLAAFFALNLDPGDEVLVPSATHWASVVPMLWTGAVPVFCESEPERMGLDPEDVARKITTRTRAMVVVHLFGMPSRMSPLLTLAERHGLKVLEDASHAPGALWRGRKCGTLGDIGVISLQTSKLAPAGEGGMFLTNDGDYFERAVCLGDVNRICRLESPARRFGGTSFGVKTRMSPLAAAIGREQLKRLDERNGRRNANLRRLSSCLEHMGIDTFLGPSHVRRVYFEYLIRCEPARTKMPVATLARALTAEGCEVSRPRYPLLHQQPLFTDGLCSRIARLEAMPDYSQVTLPRTEAASRDLIRLPTFPSAATELLDQYASAFAKVLSHSTEIAERAREDTSAAS